mmetsp:Transcript_90499/g.235664  ORF Transcript_90499/g.235664 Transcript_90499/m.235664 type:complete len:138 (-) Transcript_90499:585-998(-)
MPSDHACSGSTLQSKGLRGEVVAVRVEDVVVAAVALVLELVVLLELLALGRAVRVSFPLELAGRNLAGLPVSEAREAAPLADATPVCCPPIVTHPTSQWAQHHLARATDQIISHPSCAASQVKGPTAAAPPGMSFRR